MPEVQVHNSQARLVYVGDVQLKPGVNSVPVKVAKELRKHPNIKELVEAGKISIGDARPATKGLKVKEAKKLIGATHDPELLAEYESEDSRPAVAKALEAQREKIGPTDEKKD